MEGKRKLSFNVHFFNAPETNHEKKDSAQK